MDGDETAFRVWAPNASAVAVVGDMNGWSPTAESALDPDPSGVWRGRLSAGPGQRYKFRISPKSDKPFDKADPFAFAAEEAPATASLIWDGSYEWNDHAWTSGRGGRIALDAPVSIYEVHLGSWRYEPGGYVAIATQLARYASDLGFTHVEVLPVTEHPFYGSWGYQTTGYFAPTARYGTPEQLMEFVDILHQHDLGVILDWVPSHFPDDDHGLVRFDGTELFSHVDPREGRHPDWDSQIFNYDRAEVRSFLLSSAHFWIERFHMDGLRVDAVASMLYRDYSRKEGEWIPNVFGGKENLGAVSFLQMLNETIYERHPGVQVIAEESTSWPGVSRPVDHGGLGFAYKWDLGWTHDTLEYTRREPIHRRFHHSDLTFRSLYAFGENFVLPLSHDEVVHGKGSLLSKMPGDRWQQFAGLRLLLAYQWVSPGKKLLFMGGEFGQWNEWDHERELDWDLDERPDYVFVFGADHIFRFDPSQMLDHHIASRAGVTVAGIRVDRATSDQFGVITPGADNRIAAFDEKPSVEETVGLPDAPDQVLASMGNYVFTTDFLEELVRNDAERDASRHDFGGDLIPAAVNAGKASVYDFRLNEIPGQGGEAHYWRDVGTLESYYDAHQDLVSELPAFDLYNDRWPILTMGRPLPPAKIVADGHGQASQVTRSLLGNGVIVSGGRVHGSVLSPGVSIGGGAVVEDSVLLDDGVIGEGAVVRRAVFDKNVVVPPGAQIGTDPGYDAEQYAISDNGVVVLAKNQDVMRPS